MNMTGVKKVEEKEKMIPGQCINCFNRVSLFDEGITFCQKESTFFDPHPPRMPFLPDKLKCFDKQIVVKGVDNG